MRAWQLLGGGRRRQLHIPRLQARIERVVDEEKTMGLVVFWEKQPSLAGVDSRAIQCSSPALNLNVPKRERIGFRAGTTTATLFFKYRVIFMTPRDLLCDNLPQHLHKRHSSAQYPLKTSKSGGQPTVDRKHAYHQRGQG